MEKTGVSKNGQMFVPSFLETPYFRFDLGEVVNNCDEAADITYDVSTPTQYSFNITARTKLTCGKLCLMQLSPNATYALTAKETAVQRQKTDDQGIVTFTLLPIVKGGELRIIVSNCSDK
jgi:hypothetical protein